MPSRSKFAIAIALLVSVLFAACKPPSVLPDAEPPQPVLEVTRCPALAGTIDATTTPFGRNLIAEIGARAFYPGEAFDHRQQGRVVLCLHYLADGHLESVRVRETTGYPLLDGSALYATGLYAVEQGDVQGPRIGPLINANALKRKASFPPIPPELLQGRESVWVDLPVDFRPANPAEFAAGKNPREPLPDRQRCQAHLAGTHVVQNTRKQAPLPPEKLQAYVERLLPRIREHMFYPQSAVQHRISRRADIQTELAEGRLQCVWIRHSSGTALFDGVALMSIGVTALLPEQISDTATLTTDSISMVQPFAFALR